MTMKSLRIAAIAAFGLALAVQPALAAGNFTNETATTWIKRSIRLYHAGSMEGSDDVEVLKANVADACDGITMEVSRPNIPDWAQRSQLNFCHAMDGLNNRLMAGKAMCRNMQDAHKLFLKADPAKDPPEVVETAQAMAELSGVLVEVFKEKHYCR